MIYNDKQLSAQGAVLEKLRVALAAAEAREADQLWLKQAEIDALKSQIADLEAELAVYRLLKSGEI